MATLITMCAVAVTQTSVRNRLRTSSLSPIPNNSRVTPRSAMVCNAGNSSTPIAFSANPAAKNPTSGGNRIITARRAAPNVTAR